MVGVAGTSKVGLQLLCHLLGLLQLPWGQSTNHPVLSAIVAPVLEELVGLHVMGIHHPLIPKHISAGDLTPHHYFHLNTLISLPAEQLSKGSSVDLNCLLATKQPQPSPDAPAGDGDEVLRCFQVMIEVRPAGVRVGSDATRALDHVEPGQVLGGVCVLIQTYTTAPLHVEVASYIVVLADH